MATLVALEYIHQMSRCDNKMSGSLRSIYLIRRVPMWVFVAVEQVAKQAAEVVSRKDFIDYVNYTTSVIR